MRRLVPLLVMLAIVACQPVASASALSYPVTSLADGGPGSLRVSIEAANAHPGEDTIPIAATGTIVLGEALPALTGDVEIGASGADLLTIERGAAAEFRIFDFADGVSGSLSGITVSGGAAPQGAGIRNGTGSLALTLVVVADNQAKIEGGAKPEVEGGGVFSEGRLAVRESVIRDNVAAAVAGTTLSSAAGAGIAARGPLAVDRSTISGNEARAAGEGGKHSDALGGGLHVTGVPATVELSTISGNSVRAETSLTDEARGGGLQGAGLTLSGSTVAGNSIFSIGGATGANIALDGMALIRDTIIAEPLGDDGSCGAPEGSGGFNLDEDGSCEFTKSSDLVNVVAGLDPVLRDNGGPTPTHALLAGSIAIDRGNAFGASSDQRRLTRPSDFAAVSNKEGGDGSDIGAFELQVPTVPDPPPVQVSESPADRRAPNTRIVSGPSRLTFDRLAKFRFGSTEPQSTFQCKLDRKKRWRRCTNPFERAVKASKHLFRVRAIDRFGNVDPTPARFGWRVKPLGG
jgi:hypothetical protein